MEKKLSQKIIDLWINEGNDISILNTLICYSYCGGLPPLLYCAYYDYKDTFLLLLENGADLNIKDGYNNNILYYAKNEIKKYLDDINNEKLKIDDKLNSLNQKLYNEFLNYYQSKQGKKDKFLVII